MILSVASGKGGTGKTILSTSLALALQEQIPSLTFLDCDVEEPNAAHFLKPHTLQREPVYVLVPEIDKHSCTFCGTCARICVFNALAVLQEDVMVFEDLCHSCGGCRLLCPEQAIREKKKRIGSLAQGQTGLITFIEGRMDIGQVLAPPLIRAVKRRAPSQGAVIIDAPPGTACTFVEAVRHSLFTLLVTEPTPFGLHDLRLAVDTLKMLNIPCGVILNRAGNGEEPVRNYCRSENIPILLTIPLDRAIASAYSRGIPLVKAKPEYFGLLRQVYEEILELTSKKTRTSTDPRQQ